jgi:hypothetical protein
MNIKISSEGSQAFELAEGITGNWIIQSININ